ncbi:glycoside hydrolase family 38 protein [Bisporella sp. PMI_857]|nr:glycoside hydrolase family 38 protein [Bisporella sp. PMI_857]
MAAISKNGNDDLNDAYPRRAVGPVGKPIAHIQQSRLSSFISRGQYESQNLLCMLDEARLIGIEHVKLFVNSIPDLARPTFKEATADQDLFKQTHRGRSFGPSWSTHWFRIHVTFPYTLLEKEHLEFQWDARNEGLVWSEDGIPLQGLTGGGRDRRIEWIFPKEWRDGKEHVFYIEMACNKIMGNASGDDDNQPPNQNTYFTLEMADIVAVNVEARALLTDFKIIADAAQHLAPESYEAHQALRVANAIMDEFRPGSQDSIKRCRKIAEQLLGNSFNTSKVYRTGSSAIVYGIGHCHIDTCWLWPWDETKRKIARSWSNQCDLMDRYPEHRFTASQAAQYNWLEQYYPDLYERVKAKVKDGKFQPIGGSWVEHDTNMPSGESLIRQFLCGQRFFESRFGKRSTTFWLPDTFGYSGQLPQLCRLAGMSRFFTQKLSWNNINKFPHTTFNWVALDGSQVLCHMAPSEKYNSECDVEDLKNSISQHKSLDQDPTSLLVFGYGDGGGGPTWEHLEKLRRCRGISDQAGGLPRATMGTSVDDFFAQLQEKSQQGTTKFATWYGELYFELHRGTYTTQANNKRNNRAAEIMLHDIELFSTFASIEDGSFKYPKEEIDEMWENVLLCQFHDCLPGSSIGLVYDDSRELYEKTFEIGKKILQSIWALKGYSPVTKTTEVITAINTLPWGRTEVVRLPKNINGGIQEYGLAKVSLFGSAAVQVLASNPDLPFSDSSYQLTPQSSIEEFSSSESESSGEESASEVAEPTVQVEKVDDAFILSNSQLRVTVQNGCITSLIDSSAGIPREVIADGGNANQFVIFDDKPLNWQAWDVEVYHLNTRQELSTEGTSVVESSRHHASVVSNIKISKHSWIKSTISLSPVYDGQPSYVEIACEVEWRETMKFLKVEFPVDVTSKQASYETQFGVMTRPTHYNTTWDMAKFEVCCHKWADLSEHGYGVSILNDSKYGFATCGNLMRLSLLRSPKAPDAYADMGRHCFRYAILPHKGALSETTIRTAFNFNNPLHLFAGESGRTISPIRLIGSPSLVLDYVKRGEDDADVSRGLFPSRPGKSVLLRVYDSLGGISHGRIVADWLIKSAWKCNILEDDVEELEVNYGKIDIVLRAFEVATFRLELSSTPTRQSLPVR